MLLRLEPTGKKPNSGLYSIWTFRTFLNRNSMASGDWTDNELLAWLDEQLPTDRMSAIEAELRGSGQLRKQLATLAATRDGGIHSVGEIWRRHRLSCPPRAELGSWLLGTVDEKRAEYIEFHLRTVGCRYCAASLEDMEQASKSPDDSGRRRRRLFESSAGYFRTPEES